MEVVISPLSITPEQFEQIKQAEAVAVSNYNSASGRFSKLAKIGTVEECEDWLAAPSLFIVFDGTEYLGSEVVRTSDLLPPEGV